MLGVAAQFGNPSDAPWFSDDTSMLDSLCFDFDIVDEDVFVSPLHPTALSSYYTNVVGNHV